MQQRHQHRQMQQPQQVQQRQQVQQHRQMQQRQQMQQHQQRQQFPSLGKWPAIVIVPKSHRPYPSETVSKKRQELGAKIQDEVSKMHRNASYVPLGLDFLEDCALMKWTLEAEHATRVLRYYSKARPSSAFAFHPAAVPTHGDILFRRKDYIREYK